MSCTTAAYWRSGTSPGSPDVADGAWKAGTLELERLRSPEVGEALAQGFRTAVFACGAVEQHGPHLPLFVDAEHGTRIAVEVARRLGRALVAPTVRVGCSDHHLDFAGSLSIRPETLEAICADYCASLSHHGFEDICIVPTHGGNFAVLKEMLPRLRAAVAGSTRVHAYTDLLGFLVLWRASVERTSPGMGTRVGGHADIAETSLMLAMHSDLVRSDLAEDGFHPVMDRAAFERIIAEGFSTVTPNGILGDARGATIAIGESAVTDLADHVAAFFRTALGEL